MFVSMHQPDYLPWLGYFNKIARSEKFIFFDTADFSGGGFHERNKIKVDGGWAYLSIPMQHTEYFKSLKDAKLPENTIWAKKHWKSLIASYGRSRYWKDHSMFFEKLYSQIGQFITLSDLNIHIIKYMCSAFGLKAEHFRSSEFCYDPNLKSTEAILAIIRQIETTEFLAGPSGKNYLIRDRFTNEGIKLSFQEYHENEHNQRFPPFIPGLSAVDLLFNEGPNSINYLR